MYHILHVQEQRDFKSASTEFRLQTGRLFVNEVDAQHLICCVFGLEYLTSQDFLDNHVQD